MTNSPARRGSRGRVRGSGRGLSALVHDDPALNPFWPCAQQHAAAAPTADACAPGCAGGLRAQSFRADLPRLCADVWPSAAGSPPPPPAGPPPPPPPFVERLGVTGTDAAPGSSGEEHGPAPQHVEAAAVISATNNALSMLRARTHAAPGAAAGAGLANDPVLRRRLCSGTQGMRLAHVWGRLSRALAPLKLN
jgi:hypothetical protein